MDDEWWIVIAVTNDGNGTVPLGGALYPEEEWAEADAAEWRELFPQSTYTVHKVGPIDRPLGLSASERGDG